MSACDPPMQAERRFKARYLNQSRWDLFPCRGPVVPCRTLSLVSATCNGTVKPWFARPAAVGRHPSQKSPGVYQRIERGVCAPYITRTMSPTSKAILFKEQLLGAEWPYIERDPRGLSSPRSQRKGLAPSDSLSSWAFSLFWSYFNRIRVGINTVVNYTWYFRTRAQLGAVRRRRCGQCAVRLVMSAWSSTVGL